MKIIILDGYAENPGDLSWAPFEQLGELTVHDHQPDPSPEAIIRTMGDAEVMIVNKLSITRQVIEGCPHLKYIGLLSTGYNIVDLEAARERGIPVCNVPGYGTEIVAQFTISLLLEICGQVALHSQAVKQGEWIRAKDFCFWKTPLVELSGKTFGCIGFGSIGQAAARIAAALGMKILATGSRPTPEGQALAEYVPLDRLLAESDVVSLHCPLLPSTQNIICAENLAKMKPSAILLNTARGGLVRDADLADALAQGRLYAAGLDVISTEPIRPDNPLLTAPHCFITPHIAWAARESRARLMQIAADNLAAFQSGAPVHVVNGL